MSATTAATSSSTRLASGLRLVVARLARRMRQQQSIGSTDDMTVARYAALAAIERMQPVTLGSLAAAEHVQPPSMTRIIDRLEAMGLATRTIDTNDRRVVRIGITPEGGRVLAEVRTTGDAFLAKRIARLNAEERALLARALPLLERIVADR